MVSGTEGGGGGGVQCPILCCGMLPNRLIYLCS